MTDVRRIGPAQSDSAMVRVDTQGGLVGLQLDDASHRNRLSEPLVRELEAALDKAAARTETRVVLLTGRPDVFCAGATREALDLVARGEIEVRDVRIAKQLLAFPLPVFAALEGHAVGGGLALALCCDLVVAASGSRYGVNFTDLGFTPGMGTTVLLPALAGHQLAAEMMFSAKYYRGRELAGRGLFAHVVPAPEVEPLARDLALRVVDKPRRVLELTKAALAAPRREALKAALAREHEMHQACFSDTRTRQRIHERYLDGPE